MSEWKEVKLGDVILHSCSGGTPKSNVSEYYDGEIPWLNTKEIDFNRIYQTERNITQKGLDNSSAKWIDEKCVIIAMYGATAGKIAINMIPLTTNQACCNLKVDDRLADFRYIYYFLKKDFKFLASLANGGAQQNLNSQIIKDYVIKLPSLSIQKEISDLLWTIDAKIETNNKLNEKLEEMAQAIFKSWFVDFEPFKDKPFHETELGMIPEGWEVVSLTDIATFTNGLAMQKFRPNYKEPHLPVLKIKELRQGFCDDSSEICIDDISDDFIADDGDIIFSWSGTLLVDIWCGGKCGVNQHLFKVTSEKYNKWFFYFWIKRHLAEFIRIAKDKAVTMGHIKRGHLTNALVVVPNEKTMQNADKIFTPIIDRIIEAKIESKRLASLLDTLLPRLMSGELIV